MPNSCKMKLQTLFTIFSISLLQAAEPTISLAGLQVVYDDAKKDFDGFTTYNMQKGYSVALIVRSDGKTMVNFDDDKAKITIGGAETSCTFFSNMAFSKDRLALKLDFKTSDAVKVEADGTIKVVGELPVTFAKGKAETKSAPFTVKVGAAVSFPEKSADLPTITVKSVGKSDYNDSFEVEFTTNKQRDEFAGFAFYTKDGKPVKAESNGSSWMGGFPGSKGKGTFSYSFKVNPTDLIIAVEKWTEKEEVTIKVDLKAGFSVPKR